MTTIGSRALIVALVGARIRTRALSLTRSLSLTRTRTRTRSLSLTRTRSRCLSRAGARAATNTMANRARAAASALALATSLAIALAACSPAPTAGPTNPATPIPSPTQKLPTATPGVTSSLPVAIDPALLGILPARVDGIEVVESPEAEIAALAGPELAAVGSAMAAGIAVDTTTGQFVYAVVIRLEPGAMDDAVFRDWRDSYNEGACSQAAGVVGTAEAQIGGRTVYIGTCNGGVRTYHVWLVEQSILISASAVGDRRLGELLMENLRP